MKLDFYPKNLISIYIQKSATSATKLAVSITDFYLLRFQAIIIISEFMKYFQQN